MNNRQDLNEWLPAAVAIGSGLQKAWKVTKWVGGVIWRKPVTSYVTYDVAVQDGQDTKDTIDWIVNLKDKVTTPPADKNVWKQIIDWLKANPGKGAAGLLIAVLGGYIALRRWLDKPENDYISDADKEKILQVHKKHMKESIRNENAIRSGIKLVEFERQRPMGTNLQTDLEKEIDKAIKKELKSKEQNKNRKAYMTKKKLDKKANRISKG